MVVDDTIAAMTNAVTLMDGYIVFAKGVPALIQTAVDKALAGGATAAQLAPLTDLIAQLTTREADMTAAVLANTPTPTLAAAKKAK